jgi:ATP-dependent DNA ligase
MRLPFAPPLAPMLSSAADALPAGEGWQFEPKWDGFRTLVFRDGDEILLQSRDEKPMNRYFPELIAPLAATLSERCVVDGEIVIVGVGGLDFETLLLRIHPAASRVKLLSAQAPASFVAWDLLALGDDDLRNAPLAVRRERLEHVLAGAAPPDGTPLPLEIEPGGRRIFQLPPSSRSCSRTGSDSSPARYSGLTRR